jgi:hypothetical protein
MPNESRFIPINSALTRMPKIKAKTAVAVGLAVFLAAGAAALAVKAVLTHKTQPDIQGWWEAVLEPSQGTKLRAVLHISATDGSYRATVDDIDQRVKNISINNFVYDYPSLKFESKEVGAAYVGELNTNTSEASGTCTWKQSGLTTALVWKRTTTPDAVPELLTQSEYTPRAGSDLQGYWKGALNAGTNSVLVAFKIAQRTDGKFVAELDSLNRRAKNVVVSSVTYTRPNVRMEVGRLGAVFEGKINSDGTIAGTWTHGRTQVPLILERTQPH